MALDFFVGKRQMLELVDLAPFQDLGSLHSLRMIHAEQTFDESSRLCVDPVWQLLLLAVHNLLEVVERMAPREHLIEHDTDGPNIVRLAVRFHFQGFRGFVVVAAYAFRVRRHRLRLCIAGKAEVAKLGH